MDRITVDHCGGGLFRCGSHEIKCLLADDGLIGFTYRFGGGKWLAPMSKEGLPKLLEAIEATDLPAAFGDDDPQSVDKLIALIGAVLTHLDIPFQSRRFYRPHESN
jgi:hypothetical protein